MGKLLTIINPDWIMVIVTAVYAIITVFILRENHKSTSLVNEQLDQAAKQFYESLRYQFMPNIKLSVVKGESDPIYKADWADIITLNRDAEETYPFYICISNCGYGIAKTVNYQWINVESEQAEFRGKIELLAVGETRNISLYVRVNLKERLRNGYMRIGYSDLLDNYYEQIATFNFAEEENQLVLLSCVTSAAIKTRRPVIGQATASSYETVAVPALVGLRKRRAVNILKKHGFNFEIWLTESTDIKFFHHHFFVIDQEIPAGASVKQGTCIRIRLSSKREEKE